MKLALSSQDCQKLNLSLNYLIFNKLFLKLTFIKQRELFSNFLFTSFQLFLKLPFSRHRAIRAK